MMNVRVLPPDTPAPDSVPYNEEYGYKYPGSNHCGTALFREDIDPLPDNWPDHLSGVWCTQPKHGDDRMHICHLREKPNRIIYAIIVWGGE